MASLLGTELTASTTVITVLVATLLLLALQAAWSHRQQKRVDAGVPLRRKMSNIGVSTLVSETATNLSIPVSLLSVDGKVSAEEFTARLQERMASDAFFLRFRSLVVGRDRSFVELADFDASRHVFSHTLREGETPVSYLETIVNKPLDYLVGLARRNRLGELLPQRRTAVRSFLREGIHVAWLLRGSRPSALRLNAVAVAYSDL